MTNMATWQRRAPPTRSGDSSTYVPKSTSGEPSVATVTKMLSPASRRHSFRAGVHFAQAVTDVESAWRVQWKLSPGVTERMVFPDTAGFKEGLSQSKFEGLR
jgi:hypothetical protein